MVHSLRIHTVGLCSTAVDYAVYHRHTLPFGVARIGQLVFITCAQLICTRVMFLCPSICVCIMCVSSKNTWTSPRKHSAASSLYFIVLWRRFVSWQALLLTYLTCRYSEVQDSIWASTVVKHASTQVPHVLQVHIVSTILPTVQQVLGHYVLYMLGTIHSKELSSHIACLHSICFCKPRSNPNSYSMRAF